MPFPTTDILDGFDRANEGPPPSASWGAKIFSAQSGLVVSSNLLASEFGTGSQTWDTQFGPDCEAYCDVGDPADAFALFFRLKDLDTSFDGYALRINPGDGLLFIERWDDGVVTTLGFTDIEVASGDSIGVQMVGDLISAFHKPSAGSWTLLLEETDGTYTNAGYIGLRLFSSGALRLDNFGGGDAVVPITGASLFRGRSFPAFDDEEVNRFEFWPAVVAATAHERAASIDATASIATSATFFSVFTRASTIDASGSITATGLHISERSASLDASATVSAAGARVVERSVAVSCTAAISVIGEFFTVFESAASLSATAVIESSGVAFSVFESAASIITVAAITTSGARIVERAASVTATVTIESSGQFFSVVERATQVSATAAIETVAEFFSVFERQATVDAVAAITTNRQVELQRQVALSVVASIAVSGGIEGGVFEHERSAALDATGAITIAGVVVRERSAALTASAALTVNHQRELQRASSLSAIAVVAANGQLVASRSVALNATVTITVSGSSGVDFHPRKIFRAGIESRILDVSRESRAMLVSRERRI